MACSSLGKNTTKLLYPMPTRKRQTNTTGFRNGRMFSSSRTTYTTTPDDQLSISKPFLNLLALIVLLIGLCGFLILVANIIETAWTYLSGVWLTHPFISAPAGFTSALWGQILHLSVGIPYRWIFDPAITAHDGVNVVFFCAIEFTILASVILTIRKLIFASGQRRKIIVSGLVLISFGPLLFSIAAMVVVLIFNVGKFLLW